MQFVYQDHELLISTTLLPRYVSKLSDKKETMFTGFSC